MSYNPIIINDATDGTSGPIIGPLRVAPHLYEDGINGTISDASHARLDESFVAFKDSGGPSQICFSKYAPFWAAMSGLPYVSLQLQNANRTLCTAGRDTSLFPTSGSQYPLIGLVDGNGYFYVVGGAGGSALGASGWGGTSYETSIQRIKRDGTDDTAVIDWRAEAPSTDWWGDAFDPYDSGTEFTAETVPTNICSALPQTDGILIRAYVEISGVTGGGHYLYLWLDEDLTPATAWWAPYTALDALGNPRRIDPFVYGFNYSPLPEGYIGHDFRFGSQKLHKVDQTGAVTATGTIATLNSPASVNDRIWFHDDGSFWIGPTVAPNEYLYISSGLADATPSWAAGSVSVGSAFSTVPPSDGDFRCVGQEVFSGDRFQIVRDNSGTILCEKEIASGEPTLSQRMLGAGHPEGVKQTSDSCYLYVRLGSESPLAAGVYKFAADNFVSSKVGLGVNIWTRGQYPHFDYTDWPVDEGA